MSNSAALRKLSAWERKLERVDDPLERAARVSAMEFRKDISRNFDRTVSPYGDKWSKRKRGYKHPPLQKTREMRRSWRVIVRGADKIEFKSTDPKARFHQEGTRFMDDRPAAPNSRGMPKRYSAILKKSAIDELSKHFVRVTGL
jgi:hypothetical protein